MKFLFHIAYLVCVSSVPITLLPERHLPPINQSLVGLRDVWSKTAHLIAKGTGRSDAKCTEGIQIDADTQYWPEDANACATKLVSDAEEHGILCCTNRLSDTPDDTFKQPPSPLTPVTDCWASAYFGAEDKDQCPTYVIYSSNQNTYYSDKTCGKKIQHGCMTGTWSKANRQCSDMGARLCTEDELTSGCADRTGCWFDQRLVWTSPKTTKGYTIQLRRNRVANGEGDKAEGEQITSGDRHHLHIREIKAFDSDGNECQLYYGGDASPLIKEGKEWEGEHLTPAVAIDGLFGKVNHNDYGDGVPYKDEDHWMQFECFCENVARIDIYNRNDGYNMARRLAESVITLSNRADGKVLAHHTITEAEATAGVSEKVDEKPLIRWEPGFTSFTIELRRPIIDVNNNNQEITSGDRHHLHIKEIKVIDVNKDECSLFFNGQASPLVSQGKRSDETPYAAIDGKLDTKTHSNFGPDVSGRNQQDHWMQFTCYCNAANIDRIQIYNRNENEKMARRLVHSVLTVTKLSDRATDSHTINDAETVDACCDNSSPIEWCPSLQS